MDTLRFHSCFCAVLIRVSYCRSDSQRMHVIEECASFLSATTLPFLRKLCVFVQPSAAPIMGCCTLCLGLPGLGGSLQVIFEELIREFEVRFPPVHPAKRKKRQCCKREFVRDECED